MGHFLMHMKHPNILIILFALLIVASVPTLCIRCAAHRRSFASTETIPHRHVGLLLGCSKSVQNGLPNLFFEYRIRAAAALYRSGKVDCLLVSGDNHRAGYDEPSDMKQALIEAGVPENQIHCDYAGFRTFDSVVRAKTVFGQSELTIISQPFHTKRAVFIARCKGIDAIAFDAQNVQLRYSLSTLVREELAKVKALLDVSVLLTQPHFQGSPINI